MAPMLCVVLAGVGAARPSQHWPSHVRSSVRMAPPTFEQRLRTLALPREALDGLVRAA